MRGRSFRFNDFKAGRRSDRAGALSTTSATEDTPFLSTALNVIPGGQGSFLTRRGGNESYVTTTTAVDAILALDGTWLIASGGGKVFSISTAGAVSDITGAASHVANIRFYIIQAPAVGGQGPVYGMNGYDTPWQWSGGNIANWTASSGTLPNGTIMAFHANRVWVAGVPTDPSVLYWSDIGDPTSWPAENVTRFDPGSDNDTITGLGTVGPNLLVFKRRKTFVLYDDETGAYRRISNSVGCIAPKSVVETPVGTFFLAGTKGVYRTDGQSVTHVSENVDDLFVREIDSGTQGSAGVWFDNHYYLCVHANGYRVLDFDADLGSWWVHSNTAFDWAAWRGSGDRDQLYAVRNATTIDKCYQPGTYRDNGANVTVRATLADQSFGDPAVNKRLRAVHTTGSGTVDLEYAWLANPSTSPSFTTRSGIFSGGTGEARQFSFGTGRILALGFSSTANADFRVEECSLFVNPPRKG